MTDQKEFREKTFDEQMKEAQEHTSVAEAMAKHYWAQSGYDHIVRCGTPPDQRMWDNPGVPLIDFMSDQEIEARVEGFYDFCHPNYTRETYEADVMREIERDRSFKTPLAKLVLFLSRAGRLPSRYQHLIKGAKQNDK